MKYIKKLWVRVVVAAVVGLLFAYVGVGITHVHRPCTSAEVPRGESISHCVSVQKVYIHPRDLLSNTQGRLTHFSETLVVVSLVSFALLGIFSLTHKEPKSAIRPKD
jgi:hypothetical protein